MVSPIPCLSPCSLTIITRIVIWRVECHWQRGRSVPVTAITAITAITAVTAVAAVAMAADYEYQKWNRHFRESTCQPFLHPPFYGMLNR